MGEPARGTGKASSEDAGLEAAFGDSQLTALVESAQVALLLRQAVEDGNESAHRFRSARPGSWSATPTPAGGRSRCARRGSSGRASSPWRSWWICWPGCPIANRLGGPGGLQHRARGVRVRRGVQPGDWLLAGGARSVLSTQWSVPDAATSSLMYLFHHHPRHRGLPAWQALRQAQVWMLDPDREPPRGMPPELIPGRGDDPAGVLSWAGFTHYGQ